MSTVLKTYVNDRERLRSTGVTRETREAWNHQGRPLIVTLEVGDILIVREKGRRTTYQVPLSEVFTWMVKRDLARKAKEKRAHRKTKRTL